VQKDRVRARVWVQAVGAAGLLVGTGLGPLAVAQQAYSTTGTVSPSALPMELRVRRVRDGVEVVIENTGSAPQLEQTNQGGSWLGRLTISRPAVLLRGPQAVALPEAGVRSLSIEGSGTVFTLRAMAVGGTPMRPPLVSADGRNVVLSFAAPLQATLQTTQRNSLAPGAVANPNFVPPLRARATAPPVGDMAVGTMVIANPSYVNVSGPPVTMTIKNAQAKNVLMALSQLGGYGFVYVDEDAGSNQEKGSASLPRPITISFRNEKYGRAINSALMAAGIQGKREGNTIFAGPRVLGKSFGPQVSKVYRLNQISSNSAADYLANLGASVTKTNTVTTSVTQGGDQNQPSGAPNSATTQTGATTTVEAYGASTGPLIGLRVTTDARLSTITLVGDSSVVNVAEQYLRQLDIRQRQVALGVKILDVGLSNDNRISNSFAFKSGNTFILNDNGVLSAIFGSSTLTAIPGEPNPGASNPDQSFIDSLRAVILSSSTKVLASPTLILSENPEQIQKDTSVNDGFKLSATSKLSGPIGRLYANESFVTVGEQVVTSYTTQDSATGAPPTCIPVFSNAGLTFGARINRIDDNGFVSFSLSPEISAVTGGLPISIGNCGSIQIVNRRRLDTGNLRVRDGQTLVLTGVISDDDRATVSKWPILGDIPLVGQFFRSSGTSRKKSELVIMVTPRIINDTEGGTYGYGFEPSTQGTRQFMNPSPSSAMPGFITQP